LDKTSVNVGSTVVDERLQQSITLRNNGALGTNYRLVKTGVLRSEQTKAQVPDKPKGETPTEDSGSSLKKETSSISGLIRMKMIK
jgi:hypothetical protein